MAFFTIAFLCDPRLLDTFQRFQTQTLTHWMLTLIFVADHKTAGSTQFISIQMMSNYSIVTFSGGSILRRPPVTSSFSTVQSRTRLRSIIVVT